MNPTTAVKARIFNVLMGAPPEVAEARAEALIGIARSQGVDPATYLSSAYLTEDGGVGTSAHLIAARIDASRTHRFRAVIRSSFRVLLEFLERDPDSPSETWATRCAGTCGLLESRRGDRPELCRGCRGGVVTTDVDAGWRWKGDSCWDLDRARSTGALSKNDGTYDPSKDPLPTLWTRAMSEGARHHCAGLFGGAVYAEGEVPQLEPGEGNDPAAVELAELDARDQARALEEVEKPARQPRQDDASVTMEFVAQSIRARSVTRGDPIIDDRIEWRRENGAPPEDVRRSRWADGSWVAWRYSHRASKLAGGDERFKAIDTWPALPTDDALSARELVAGALPERPPVGISEPKTEVSAPIAPADMTPAEREAHVEKLLAQQRAKPESQALRESLEHATKITDADLRTHVGGSQSAPPAPSPDKGVSIVQEPATATPPGGNVPTGAPSSAAAAESSDNSHRSATAATAPSSSLPEGAVQPTTAGPGAPAPAGLTPKPPAPTDSPSVGAGVEGPGVDECPVTGCGAAVLGVDADEMFEGAGFTCPNGHDLEVAVEDGRAWLVHIDAPIDAETAAALDAIEKEAAEAKADREEGYAMDREARFLAAKRQQARDDAESLVKPPRALCWVPDCVRDHFEGEGPCDIQTPRPPIEAPPKVVASAVKVHDAITGGTGLGPDAVAQLRRERAAKWGYRPNPKAKGDLFTDGSDPTRVCCRECGKPVLRAQHYRRGVEGYEPGLAMTKRGVMCGVAHETCRRLLAAGKDPKAVEEAPVSAPEGATT